MDDQISDDRAEMDSVDHDASDWLAELPKVDPEIESARMRLRRIGKLAERMLAEIARHHGLTLGDWETLSVLRRSGQPYVMTPSELVEGLGVTSGTVSVRIERLLRAGLIEPANASDDGRSRPVQLTSEGGRLWRAATIERTEAEARIFKLAFGTEEIRELNKLLRWLMLELEAQFGLLSSGHNR